MSIFWLRVRESTPGSGRLLRAFMGGRTFLSLAVSLFSLSLGFAFILINNAWRLINLGGKGVGNLGWGGSYS